MGLEADAVDSYALAEHSLDHVIHSLGLGILPLHVEVVDDEYQVISAGGSCGVEGYLNIVIIVTVAVQIPDDISPVGVIGDASYGICVKNLVADVPYLDVVLIPCYYIGNIGSDSFLKLFAGSQSACLVALSQGSCVVGVSLEPPLRNL